MKPKGNAAAGSGGGATRELAIAAKAGKGARGEKALEEASKAANRAKEFLKDESGYIRLPGKRRYAASA